MRIVIVDDDLLVCRSLQTIITAKGYDVVGIGYSGLDAIDLYQTHQPDVLMMDIRMEIMNGVEASKQIIQRFSDAKILFLTTFSDDEYIIKALHIGVKGYILKQNYEAIATSLEAIYQGQNVFNTEIIAKLPSLMKATHVPEQTYSLTERELQIITCIAHGYNNREISQKLFLSEGTIRNYLSMILDKLELRDRTQLAVFYYQKLSE